MNIDITLPERENMDECIGECVTCYGETERAIVSSKYHMKGVDIRVNGINAIRCKKCGDEFFSHDEAKRIEDAIDAVMKKDTDEKCQHIATLASRFDISESQAVCWFDNFHDDKRCDGCPSLDICWMMLDKDMEDWDASFESD